MPKYTTITELAAAFQSGELDQSYFLLLDKGGSSIGLRKEPAPNETDDELEERYRHTRALFRFDEDQPPLVELFRLAGIRAEWA